MAKKSKGRKPRRKTPSPPRKYSRLARSNGISSDGARWLRLLADPCSGTPCRPCYPGPGSGLFIRTTDQLDLTFNFPTYPGVVGAITQMDLVFNYCPNNLSAGTGGLYAGHLKGMDIGQGTDLRSIGLPNNPISTDKFIGRYRAVAACVEWVPTGFYQTRSGTVGLAYTPSSLFRAGDFEPTDKLGLVAATLMQRFASNGSERHEVRWLPSEADAKFTTVSAYNDPDWATVSICLRNIDCTYSTGTIVAPNGYFQISTVWEYVPHDRVGLSVTVNTPTKETVQSVLSNIKNIGAFVFKGLYNSLNIDEGTPTARLLSAGVGVLRNTAKAMVAL